jgi:hypothetical protein
MLSRKEMEKILAESSRAWDAHDLEGILRLMDEDVTFENWTGAKVRGKENLRRAWGPWFENQKGFHFHNEDTFIDEAQQKVLTQWTLTWPSPEKGFEGKPEIRRGVDVYHFKDGKIINKFTFSKTTVEIDGKRVKLTAGKP